MRQTNCKNVWDAVARYRIVWNMVEHHAHGFCRTRQDVVLCQKGGHSNGAIWLICFEDVHVASTPNFPTRAAVRPRICRGKRTKFHNARCCAISDSPRHAHQIPQRTPLCDLRFAAASAPNFTTRAAVRVIVFGWCAQLWVSVPVIQTETPMLRCWGKPILNASLFGDKYIIYNHGIAYSI